MIVTVRLPEAQREGIEDLVEEGRFDSRTDAILAAIDRFLESRGGRDGRE